MSAGSGAASAEAIDPVLVAERITKRFGEITALDGVSLGVGRGDCVALVGESGSGKTTLLRCFNRMVVPDSGRVLRDGRDVQSLDGVDVRRRTGYVPQEGGLLPHWRVLRNTAMVPWLRGFADAEQRARKCLEVVGLDPEAFGNRWPSELSGGQRQRVAIARALASDPDVLLLDEPFGALDAITRSELQDAFGALRRRLGVTTVLVTHDLHEAFALAEQIGVVRAGQLEQLATPEALRADPATPYVRRLLDRARIAA